MLRVVVIEQEEIAKNLIFTLSKILDDEFSFVHYDKISDFFKKDGTQKYDLIVLNEEYNNIRVTSALEYQKNKAIVIYCSQEDEKQTFSPYARIFTINTNQYERDLKKIKPYLIERLSKHKEYLFSYNGVNIKMKYHDIYYIEKEGKNLVYHTQMGEFRERGSISEKSAELLEYDFIRINSGIIVNYEYIFQVMTDDIELQNHSILPISRARKSHVNDFIRKKIHNARN